MPKGIYDRAPRQKPLESRLFSKIEKQKDGCWFWTGAKSSFGYGTIYSGGPKSGGRKNIMAHRALWELRNGPIPDGKILLHSCDTPWCVNPEHLSLGTKAENSRDMVAKNRQRKGEGLPQSKLTPAQVEAIRNCTGITMAEIAAIAGISSGHVSEIKSRKTWASL